MLPAAHRLTGADDFRAVVRGGRRAGSRTLVVHLADQGEGGPRAGFVVSRAVGNAVTRNRVQRRLRHLVREQLDSLPGTSALVVRALPASATASAVELRSDLVRCLQQASSAGSRGVPAS